jgi:AcrR family transcriptional regulator
LIPSTPDGGSAPVRNSDRYPRLTQGSRHAQVIEAAFGLFADKGFQGTKTKEIAEAAGINEALIFRDFQTKEKLYFAILDYAASRIPADQWVDEVAADAEARNDDAVFGRLAQRIVETYVREQMLFRLMLYCALEQHELAQKFRQRQIQPVENFIQSYIQARQEEGAFRDADVRALAGTFLGLCHHHVLRRVLYCGEPEGAASGNAAKQIAEVFLNGVRSH